MDRKDIQRVINFKLTSDDITGLLTQNSGDRPNDQSLHRIDKPGGGGDRR